MEKLPPSHRPVGKSVGVYSRLMIEVGEPIPLWTVPLIDTWFGFYKREAEIMKQLEDIENAPPLPRFSFWLTLWIKLGKVRP